MSQEPGVWTEVVHKTFGDSEVTQAIVVVEDDPSGFRLVQTFHRKRLRVRAQSTTELPAATYRIDSQHATREQAIEQAERLVARYRHNGWRNCAWTRACKE